MVGCHDDDDGGGDDDDDVGACVDLCYYLMNQHY